MTVRIVRTSPLLYSQRVVAKLQQWIKGEWRDVEVLNVTYPLPTGRTK